MLFFVVVKGLCSCVTSFEFGVFSGASVDLKYKVRLNQKHEVINTAERFFCCCQFWGLCVLSGASFKVRPEVIDTAEGLLRVDHVEVDDRVHTDRHRVSRQNLGFKKMCEFQFYLL